MKLSSFFIWTLWLPLSLSTAFGQDSTGVDHPARTSEPELPTLETCIDSAVAHSAMVQFRNLDILAKASSVRSEKNYWTRNLSLQADNRYGTFPYFTSGAGGAGIVTTTISQFNYAAGVSLTFPLEDLLDRKNKVHHAQVELQEAKSMASAQKEEVRQLVIHQYEDLLLKQKLLRIKSLSMSNARINMETVEKEFRNGTVTTTEYMRISQIVSNIESEFESAKSDYISSRMILEEIVGFKFQKG